MLLYVVVNQLNLVINHCPELMKEQELMQYL